MRRRPRRLLLCLLGLAPACAAFDSTPDTPGNAVFDWVTTEQVGRDGDRYLCDRLRNSSDAAERDLLERLVDEAAIAGDDERPIEYMSGDVAMVSLDVHFVPYSADDAAESWLAEVIRERGQWKVCGFAPRT